MKELGQDTICEISLECQKAIVEANKNIGFKSYGVVKPGFDLGELLELHDTGGLKHLDVTMQLSAKEKALDFDEFINQLIRPAIYALMGRIGDLKGKWATALLPFPGCGITATGTDNDIAFRCHLWFEQKTLQSMLSIDCFMIEVEPPTVFLGGTCNKSLWRDALISALDKKNIKYFNPVVENWTPECMEEELKQREECDYCLYTITPRIMGVYSVSEVVDDSNKRPDKTLMCITEFDHDFENPNGDTITYDDHMAKSLIQTARMVEKNGAMVFETLGELAEFLNN